LAPTWTPGSTQSLIGKTAYAMSTDKHVFATAFISNNADDIAHFNVYDVPHSKNIQKGTIVSVKTDFEITGVALGMSDDTDTIAIGVFGKIKSSVCVFKFKSSDWTEDGECVSNNESSGNALIESTFDLLGRTAYTTSNYNHVLVTAFISNNTERIAHFEAFNVLHAGFKNKGKIASVPTVFDITGVAVKMSDDTNTVDFGVFGSDTVLVCVFKFKYSVWSQDGGCLSYDM